MKILTISGSLRAASINTMLLRAVSRLAPTGISVELCREIGNLPLYNPDLDAKEHSSVERLFAQIASADAILIASPEYAHGITGVLKNALDWVVGSEFFINKPVALFNASPRAIHAQAALRETVLVMSAQIIDSACIALPLLGANLSEDDVVRHSEFSVAIMKALNDIQTAVIADRQAIHLQ